MNGRSTDSTIQNWSKNSWFCACCCIENDERRLARPQHPTGAANHYPENFERPTRAAIACSSTNGGCRQCRRGAGDTTFRFSIRQTRLTRRRQRHQSQDLTTYAKKVGCTFASASNGLEAVEQYKASKKRFDIVFMGESQLRRVKRTFRLTTVQTSRCP